MVTSIDELDLDKKYSYADYLQWDLGEQVELIKGKVFRMSPAPSRQHQLISTRLLRLILPKFSDKSCEVYHAPFDVRLYSATEAETFTVVQPDICVICDLTKLDERGLKGTPDLIIEILSPSTSQKDRGEKYHLYQEAEVKEYWIVDPVRGCIEQYEFKDGKFTLHKTHFAHGYIQSVVFPDLQGGLDEVFAD